MFAGQKAPAPGMLKTPDLRIHKEYVCFKSRRNPAFVDSRMVRKVESMSLFSMPIQELKGVGPKRAKLFERIGAPSVGALLRLYPRA